MENRKNNHFTPLFYVALGNSLTAGVGAGFAPGFVQRYAYLAEKALQRRIIIQVFARPGATSREILNMSRHPHIKHNIQQASIITLNVGGNDLIQAAQTYSQSKEQRVLEEALKECKKNIAEILQEIKQIKSDSNLPYVIKIVNIYNPFPEIELSGKWMRLYNKYLNRLANGHILIADICSAFKGREEQLLTNDRIHPNAEGYQVIAEELDRLGYPSV